ncbi:dimethyl sulfone monooxygenase SfnG [Streptomyces sp. MA5143a]|nr:dimethyl sulfone monooxygenase SfnG [Streptomyces sp. MA5143a]
MPAAPLKFAYWVPDVSGGLVTSRIEQRTDWGYAYNRELAVLAKFGATADHLSHGRFAVNVVSGSPVTPRPRPATPSGRSSPTPTATPSRPSAPPPSRPGSPLPTARACGRTPPSRT